jgi:hypothetical protein
MLVCILFCANRTRDRGCSAHPVFPAPSVFEGKDFWQKLGRDAPRECGIAIPTTAVIARESGRSSIPETPTIDPIGRSVLDRPVKPGDDGKGCLIIESEIAATSLRGA